MIPFFITDTTEYLKFNPLTYVPKKATKVVEPEIKLDPEIEKIRETIKYMESRGEAAKGKGVDYAFSQPSGNPEDPKYLGLALGAYQITEARLSEKGRMFLGKKATKEEFLASSELQDQFARAQIKWQQDNGMLLDSIFATHRGGWGKLTRQDMINRKTKWEQYVREAMTQYNIFTQEEQKQLERELATKKPEVKKETKKETKTETKKPISALADAIVNLFKGFKNGT